mgnify:CR=1 FL=1
MTGHAALWYAGTDRKCTESLYKLIVEWIIKIKSI